ncbi:MAG: pyridoxal phosphate-dependent aminotransferase [Candidatus Omnitrophica bacterium]|nr:pyridoxal phosphate-dependent aminotransferase [Candidatus Omnitrophota bacterium]
MKLSGRALQLKPSVTLAITQKVKEMRERGIDVIGFGAGEPDFDTPLNIKKSAIKAIEDGFTKYTASSGIEKLKEAVCEKFKKDNSLSYKPEEVVISCGAKHALYNILQVLCDKNDEVIIFSPYWVSYTEMVRLSSAEPRIVETAEADSFIPDTEKLKKAITKRTRAIIINSPSNPTGAVIDTARLEELARIAVSKNIFVISDEIYEMLIYDGLLHRSIGSLNDDIKKLTLTVNGVSKTYSMTGWRIGFVAGPLEVIKKIGALQSHSTSNPTSISQMAALEALKNTNEFAEQMRKEFALRRNRMIELINRLPRVSCTVPKGAFYTFPNISKTGYDSVRFAEKLLDEAHVACVPGIAFGSDAHIRLSFATSMRNIETGLERIYNLLRKEKNETDNS